MTFILIHGAWHGAWCWYKVFPLLERTGHKVLMPDLPGHGNDKTSLSDVSLELYTNSICQKLNEQQGKVVLVGHSMAGIVISQVAEKMPEKVNRLVYLTGFLLEDGDTLLRSAVADKEALVQPNLIISRDRLSASLNKEILIQSFYPDCSEQDIAYAIAHVTPQALAPLAEPVLITEKNWGSVPRSYIECTGDKAITIDAQREMYNKLPCERVVSMDTAHSPFLSSPEKLVENILLCTADN